MSEDKLSDAEMEIAMYKLQEIWDNSTSVSPGFRNVIEEMARNPEQEGPDLVGEIVLLSQKIADLETAKDFHMACIENIIERLNEVVRKNQTRFAEGFHKGREFVLRENKSGCCCIVNDSDEIISVCGAHEQWGDNLLKKLSAIEQQFLEVISHGCCIPVCSKHQGPVEIKGNG